MKMRILYILALWSFCVISCTPEELPPDVIEVPSPFETIIEIDGFSENFEAEDYAMITGWGADRMHEDFLSFWGQYVPADCADDCGPELSFEFYDVEDRSSSQVNPLEILMEGEKEYALPPFVPTDNFILKWEDFGGVQPVIYCTDILDITSGMSSSICDQDNFTFNINEEYPTTFNVIYGDGIQVLGGWEEFAFPFISIGTPRVEIVPVDTGVVRIDVLNVNSIYDVYIVANEDTEPVKTSSIVVDYEDALPFVGIELRLKDEDFSLAGVALFLIEWDGGGDRSFSIPYVEPERTELDFSKLADKVRLVLTTENETYATGIFEEEPGFFDIISIEPYLDNESGDQTYLIHADISATLSTNNPLEDTVTIEAENVPFAVAFPK